MFADRVQETTTTTGTGDYSLGSAVAGYRTFLSAFVDGDTVYYCATDDRNWEVGIGTVQSATTSLARTAILTSSNADAAVNWGASYRSLRIKRPLLSRTDNRLGQRYQTRESSLWAASSRCNLADSSGRRASASRNSAWTRRLTCVLVRNEAWRAG